MGKSSLHWSHSWNFRSVRERTRGRLCHSWRDQGLGLGLGWGGGICQVRSLCNLLVESTAVVQTVWMQKWVWDSGDNTESLAGALHIGNAVTDSCCHYPQMYLQGRY